MTRKKILLVDDEKELVKLLKMRLEATGYEVIPVYDGQRGLEKIKKDPPDLIILDLILPKMGGYRFCDLLKSDARYKKIPIIMFTALAQEVDKALGKKLGADAYITKPFEAQVLLSKIKELLESNRR